AASHVVTQHPDVAIRDLQGRLETDADAEHVLRRLPHGELLAVPARHRAMRLQAVVELRRRAERALDRDRGFGEGAFRVTALVRTRFRDVPVLLQAWRVVTERLLEVRHEGQEL